MRSEGFLFLSEGLGAGNAFAHDRARPRYARCAVPLGLAVSGLFGGSVTSLCRGDWWWACRVGGAIPL